MLRKIIFSSAVFLFSALLGLIVFFPLNQVAEKAIKSYVSLNRLEFAYDEMNITFFGADIRGIVSKDLIIDEIKVNYNPIGLLLRRLSFEAESPFFLAEGRMAGNNLEAEFTASVGAIAELLKTEGSGSFTTNIAYNVKSGDGDITLDSGAITLVHPLINVDVDSVEGDATIVSNKLTINTAEAVGSTSLSAEGTININPNVIDMSLLDIRGTASLSGLTVPFTLVGTAKRARLNITN